MNLTAIETVFLQREPVSRGEVGTVRCQLPGACAERLLVFGAVDTPQADAPGRAIVRDLDRVAIGDGYDVASEVFGGEGGGEEKKATQGHTALHGWCGSKL